MFNGYIAKQRLAMLERERQLQVQDQQWKKRYHTQIQPRLLEHYGKRLLSFMHQMDQHPLIINPESQTPVPKEPHFTFRSPEDWKSVFTARQRRERRENEQIRKQTMVDGEQEQLIRKGHEYRSREKGKEMHPPMRYAARTKEEERKFSLREFKQRKKEQSRMTGKFEHNNAGKDNITTVSTSSNKYYQDEQGDFNLTKRNKTQSIEVEARRYEKERQIVEKKKHFKKLMDLSITASTDPQKMEIKSILRKCGYLQRKRVITNTQVSETDKFSSLIEKVNR